MGQQMIENSSVVLLPRKITRLGAGKNRRSVACLSIHEPRVAYFPSIKATAPEIRYLTVSLVSLVLSLSDFQAHIRL